MAQQELENHQRHGYQVEDFNKHDQEMMDELDMRAEQEAEYQRVQMQEGA